MENNSNRDYGQNNRNPQNTRSGNFQSELNREDMEAQNSRNATPNSQWSPENGADANVRGSSSDTSIRGSENSGQAKNLGNDFRDAAEFSGDYDERNYNDSVEDNDLIPNMSSSNADDRRNHVANPDNYSDDSAFGANRDNDPYRTPGL